MSKVYQLVNDHLTASVTSFGAELISLKDTEGTKYIWNADEKYWKRHTPILFPIVGKILDGKYTYEGKEYELPAHGFARDMDFEVEEAQKDKITFILCANEKTKSMYPFAFKLKVIYTLKEKDLDITYEVINQDTKEIYFKLGAHPGFMCPWSQNERIEDYYLEFEKEEEITEILVTPEVYLSDKTQVLNSQRIPLNKTLFNDGPLVFADYKSTKMTLGSDKQTKKLTVAFEGFPFLGIWSTTDEAPFVCIEPWYGHADYVTDSKEIGDKKDILRLQPSSTFTCTHTIKIS